MKKYRVKLNNKVYEVELEVISEDNASIAMPSSAQPVAQPTGLAETIKAPMQGKVFKVLVAPNQMVKKGQPLLLLEVMKMENEIVAPRDCMIVDILAKEGSSVNHDDSLIAIK